MCKIAKSIWNIIVSLCFTLQKGQKQVRYLDSDISTKVLMLSISVKPIVQSNAKLLHSILDVKGHRLLKKVNCVQQILFLSRILRVCSRNKFNNKKRRKEKKTIDFLYSSIWGEQINHLSYMWFTPCLFLSSMLPLNFFILNQVNISNQVSIFFSFFSLPSSPLSKVYCNDAHIKR